MSAPPSIRRPGRRIRGRQSAAFTILEVMLAIFVFSLVLTAIYYVWAAVVRGTKSSLNAAAAVQRSRIAMRSLEDALLTAQMFNANQKRYAFIGTSEDLELTARLPASFLGVGRYGDQILRRVQFRLQPGKEGMDELVMTQAPLLMDMSSGEEPYTLVLARDVSLFNLEYWDHMRREWVEEWVLTNQLPMLVQVSLGMGKIGNSSKPQDVVTRIVALPSSAVTVDLQGGLGMPVLNMATNRFSQPAGGLPPGGGYPPGSYPPGGYPQGGYPPGNVLRPR